MKNVSKKRKDLLERQDYLCLLCGLELKLEEATLEHIYPVSCGGPDSVLNFGVSHSNCNRMRSNQSLNEEQRVRAVVVQAKTLLSIISEDNGKYRTWAFPLAKWGNRYSNGKSEVGEPSWPLYSGKDKARWLAYIQGGLCVLCGQEMYKYDQNNEQIVIGIRHFTNYCAVHKECSKLRGDAELSKEQRLRGIMVQVWSTLYLICFLEVQKLGRWWKVE